ncbi:hypothetical protein ABE485_12140 [Achromobacter spanius]|uniref:hypothetical protein n=1 Tax=Achromobacter spanius TaxID=217203 RepID=UPI00320AC7E8
MRSPSLNTARPIALHALPTLASTHGSNADDYPVVKLAPRELTDADILSVLCDLFAGRAARAFGEPIDWWTETLQCDLSPTAAAGVALTAISKWQFDRDAGAAGVKRLQDELVLRARQILGKGGQP